MIALRLPDLFFQDVVEPIPDELIAKGLDAKQSAAITQKAYEILSALPDLNDQTAEPPMRTYVEQSGLSANQVFGIMRVAVTGQKVSPPLFESIEVIGKDKTLERLRKAMEMLEKL